MDFILDTYISFLSPWEFYRTYEKLRLHDLTFKLGDFTKVRLWGEFKENMF